MPQIFFNSTYIGGNHELQEQWKDEAKKEELLKILESEPDQGKYGDPVKLSNVDFIEVNILLEY